MAATSDVLLTPQQAETYLGLPTGTVGEALQGAISGLFDLLQLVTRQTFVIQGTRTDEPYNGMGTPALWLREPATSVTTVKIGQRLTTPDETLAGSDPDQIVIDAQRPRRIVRTDGAVFPRGMRNVFVTYPSAGNVTEAARSALRAAVAFAWRRRGSEDAFSESEGGFFHQLLNDLAQVPEWAIYVERMGRSAAL